MRGRDAWTWTRTVIGSGQPSPFPPTVTRVVRPARSRARAPSGHQLVRRPAVQGAVGDAAAGDDAQGGADEAAGAGHHLGHGGGAALDDVGEGGGEVRLDRGIDALDEDVEVSAAGQSYGEGVVGVPEAGALRGSPVAEHLSAQFVDRAFDAAAGDAADGVAPSSTATDVPTGRGALPVTSTTVARAKGRPSRHQRCSVSAMFSMNGSFVQGMRGRHRAAGERRHAAAARVVGSDQRLGGDGQFTDPAAGGVEDRVADRGRHPHLDDLAEPLHPQRVARVVLAVQVDRPDLGDIGVHGHEVVGEVGV
ncbi:hypothetical protein QF034_000362 [Streptomyces africanus]|uniref:Uncharacterized protein n=1 Tax=Streptomyces africanus TaxID=231024 RepID=A0ABU0QFG4_9ACTN|nr:hypothetical protein [Streptomyces africanus]